MSKRKKYRRVNVEENQIRDLDTQKALFAIQTAARNEDLPESFALMEHLLLILDFQLRGKDFDRLHERNSEDWGAEKVEVPARLLAKVLSFWAGYTQSDNPNSLGKSFGVEGSQGRKKAKAIYRTLQRNIDLAQSVVWSLIEADESGAELSVAEAITQVSESSDVDYDTVRLQYQKYAGPIKEFFIEQGILESIDNETSY